MRGAVLRAMGGGLVVATLALLPAAASAGDRGRGEQLYAKHCVVCHALEPEFHKEGPSLYRIWGRRAGTVPYFGRYKGLRGATFSWDEKTMDAWLADPRALVSGKDSAMTLRVENAQDRADLIAFLKTLR